MKKLIQTLQEQYSEQMVGDVWGGHQRSLLPLMPEH
jgi:hypothetical protein